jgi:RNA polymerase sigma-54 factor
MSPGLRQGPFLGHIQVQRHYQGILLKQIVFLMHLALPLAKIEELVKRQLDENPALQYVDDDVNRSQRDRRRPGPVPATSSVNRVDYNHSELHDDASFRAARQSWREVDETATSIEDYVPARESLYRSLKRQLTMTPLSPRSRKIGKRIIGAIDANGYVTEPMARIAAKAGCSLAEAEAVLHAIQGFTPTGVGARTPGECMRLILEDLGFKEATVLRAAEATPKVLRRMSAADLSKIHGLDSDRAGKLARLLRRIDLRPGASVSATPPPYIRPDVILRIVDGVPLVEINDGFLTSVKLDGMVGELASDQQLAKEQRQFLRRNWRDAKALLLCLEMRKNLLLRVVAAIIRHQPYFLESGMDGLVPLKMRTIADELKVAESTVSRAVKGKVISTPFGNYELKEFFSGGWGTEGPGAVSSTVIRNRIARIIEEESKDSPITDMDIVFQIRSEMPSVVIARRTVAKYRRTLGIPGVRERKAAA